MSPGSTLVPAPALRIAVAAHSATRAGGVETYLAEVVPALAARGHAVACWFESAAAERRPVLAASFAGPSWTAGTDADPLKRLREWKPQVIYLHGLRSPALELELTRLAPVVFFAHSYYGACISGERTTRFPVLAPCRRVFGAGCLAHYLPRGCGGLSPVTMMRSFATQRRKGELLRQYAAVLAASGHMSRVYGAQGIDARVVPLPASNGAARPPRRPAAGAPSTLLFLGRLERSKGVDVALESSAIAARALGRHLRLVIAGQGAQEDALRRRASVLVRDTPHLSVEFAGWLDDAGRAAVLNGTDLLLVPSVWPEPFGLVGVEAGLAGVPALAFDVGGVSEWLADGTSGRLVAWGSKPVLRYAEAMSALLGDAAALARMRAGAAAAARRFSMSAHLDALEGELRDAIARSAAGPASRVPA